MTVIIIYPPQEPHLIFSITSVTSLCKEFPSHQRSFLRLEFTFSMVFSSVTYGPVKLHIPVIAQQKIKKCVVFPSSIVLLINGNIYVGRYSGDSYYDLVCIFSLKIPPTCLFVKRDYFIITSQ